MMLVSSVSYYDINGNWKLFPFLGFTQGRWLIRGQGDVRLLTPVRSGITVVGIVNKWALCWRKSPFLPFHRSQTIPVLLWSGVWRDWQTSCGCLWVVSSGPPVLCNLPVNHIRGPQTAQQALTGEPVMFLPLRSHSSLSKLLTIYLDVIVCNIIKSREAASLLSCLFVWNSKCLNSQSVGFR